jgi:4-hydroxybenzoyl-CoA thioesterase
MKFEQRIRYRFGDIDDAGIAYYPKLLHCFHCAFEDWWSDALGRPYAALMHEDKLGLPAVHLDVDFFAPIRYGDEPIVHLGVLHLGESSVEFGFWMTHPADPRPLGRARGLPQLWRDRLAAFQLADGEFPAGR